MFLCWLHWFNLNIFRTLAMQTMLILVSMAGGHYKRLAPSQYEEFMDKYLTWLERRKS